MITHKHRLVAAGTALALGAVAWATAGSGSASAAPKSPFRVGFVSTTEGASASPGAMSGERAAVSYLNAHGGLNGHPIQVVECGTDGSQERNQACAQAFANDKSLQMVITGLMVTAGSFFSTMTPTGIPIVQMSGDDPGTYNAVNTVDYVGASPNIAVGFGEMATAAKPSSITYLAYGGGPGLPVFNMFMARYKGDHSKVTKIDIPPTATDVLPYLVSGNVKGAGLVIDATIQCVPVAKALNQLGVEGTKVLVIPSCLNQANLGVAPGLFDGWRTALYVLDPLLGPGKSKSLDTFLTEYPKYGGTTPVPARATAAWAAFLSTAAALRGAPDSVLYNRKALFPKLYAFTGPVPLGQQQIKCGSIRSVGSTFCTLGATKVQINTNKMVILQ